MSNDVEWEDLLVPIFRAGKRVYDSPPLSDIRARTVKQMSQLHPAVRRFTNPHEYPAGLERRLAEMRTQLILQARAHPTRSNPGYDKA
jgi:nicotinate phosphoribosyltransferase